MLNNKPPFFRRPVELTASLYKGGTVPCIAFVSPDHRLIEDGLPPSERYLDLLRTGDPDLINYNSDSKT